MSTSADRACAPESREPLSPRQAEVIAFLRGYIDQHGYPPSLRDIGKALRITSTNGVNDHLVALERKGYITRDALKSRAIVLCAAATDEEMLIIHRERQAFHAARAAELERRIAAHARLREDEEATP